MLTRSCVLTLWLLNAPASSVIAILFPVFASYKALRTADPAQLSPWLMYWVIFALLTLVETHLSLLLFFVPFYSTMRLLVLLYLVLPQTQGARVVYQTHIHPFLSHNESRIEQAIVDIHASLKANGLDYARDIILWFQKHLLGKEPSPAPASYAGSESYVSNLLARFNLPSARDGLAAPASDFYGLLSAAAATIGRGVGNGGGGGGAADHAGAAARDAQIEHLSRSGTLIPAHLTDAREQASFLTMQREKLRILLGALDKQATELEAGGAAHGPSSPASPGPSADPLHRTKSETGFERIDRDLASPSAAKDSSSGGWLGWALGGQKSDKDKDKDRAEGTSSGVDARPR